MSRTLLRDNLPVVILAVLGFVWLNMPFLLPGPFAYIRGFEIGDTIYPQLAPLVRMVQEGRFSFWLPSQDGGTDLLDGFNAPIFNILLFLAFPHWLAHSLVFAVVTLTAFVGMYRLLRHGFQAAKWSAFLAGALFTLWFFGNGAGYVYTWITGLAYALAPAILLHLLRAQADGSRRRWLASALLGLGVAIGGHYTWTAYLLGLVAIATAAIAPSRIRCWLPHFLLICALVGLVQWPFFLANTHTLELSGRPAGEALHVGQSVLQLFVLYSRDTPSWFPQVPMMIAAVSLVGLCRVFLRSRGDSGISAAKNALTLGAVAVAMPLLDSVLLYLFSRLGIVGFSFLPNGEFGGPFDFRFRHAIFFLAVAATALALEYLWRYATAQDGLGQMLVRHARLFFERQGPVATHFLFLRLAIVVVAFYALLVAIDIGHALTYYFGMHERMRTLGKQGANFVSYYLHPDLSGLAAQRKDFSRYRVATIELDDRDEQVTALKAGFQAAYGFELADGSLPNIPTRYLDYWQLMLTGVPPTMQEEARRRYRTKFGNADPGFPMKPLLYEPAGSRGVINDGCVRVEKPIDFSALYNLPMLSLANVEYVVSAVPIADSNLTLLASEHRDRLKALECDSWGRRRAEYWEGRAFGRPLYIYRNERVLPRVFAPRSVELFENDGDLQQQLIKRNAPELGSRLLARRSEFPARQPDSNGYDVKVQTFKAGNPDRWTIDVQTASGGPLVLANNYSRYWKASVDGTPAATFPAYHAFIGIWLPPGAKKVELRYLPPPYGNS